jgi:hypothetical protein
MNKRRVTVAAQAMATIPLRLALSAVLAGATVYLILGLAEFGVPAAKWLATPFALAGFVFGNIHQGSESITYGSMGVVAFILIYIGLTAFVIRFRSSSPDRILPLN